MRAASVSETSRTCIKASTKMRNAASVGTRPAEVCGCTRYPVSSKSASSFRIVAAERENPYLRVRVRLPTGSAVAMNSVTTAYSTERARLLRGGLTDIAFGDPWLFRRVRQIVTPFPKSSLDLGPDLALSPASG